MSANVFGKELRRLRRAAELALVDLANAAGVSVVYVSQIERGDKAPPARNQIEAMLKRIGCTELLDEMLRLADLSRRAVEIGLKNKTEEQADMLLALKRKADAGEITDQVAREIRRLLGG